MRRISLMILIPLTLAACSNQGLRDLRTDSSGPDEFMIQPVKPLEQPSSYADLPAPTPGQGNITDRSAIAEGVVAFAREGDAGGMVEVNCETDFVTKNDSFLAVAEGAAALVARHNPADVAAQVLDAVRTGRFYVLTHPEWVSMAEARVARMVAGEDPALDTLPM